MVPVRLQLQNFLSYGEDVPPLDFAGLRMACLSGANGHGKSALLEALTWALWGEARKGRGVSRPHAGLLRLGATEMWVDLLFDQEGQRYRVRRGFRRSGRASSATLDFFVWDADADHFRPLTQPHAGATQERIDALLRMDYATFINSAFLLQGQADEFTRKGPADRKQVLADILGLARYDRLCELAKARRNACDQQLGVAEASLTHLAAETADRAAVHAEHEAVCAALVAAEQHAAADELTVEELRGALAADQQRRDRLAELARDVQRLRTDLAVVAGDLTTTAARLAELDALLATRDEVAGLVAERERLLAERERAAALADRRRALVGQRDRLLGALATAKAQAEHEVALASERVRTVESRADMAREVLRDADATRAAQARLTAAQDELRICQAQAAEHERCAEALAQARQQLYRQTADLEAAVRDLRRRAADHAAQAARLADCQQALAAARERSGAARDAVAEAAHANSRLAAIQAEFEALHARRDGLDVRLKEVAAHQELLVSGGGTCPVCRQRVSGAQQGSLAAGYERQQDDLRDERRAIDDQARAIKAERDALRAKLPAVETLAATALDRQGELVRAQESVATAETAAVAAREIRDQAAAAEQRLAQGDYAPAEHEAVAQAETALAAVGYDARRLAALAAEVEGGRAVLAAWLKLQEAERAAAACAVELAPLRDQLAAAEAVLRDERYATAERADLTACDAALAALTVDEQDVARLDDALRPLAEAPLRWQRVTDAAERAPAERARAARLRDQECDLTGRLAADEAEHAALAAELLDRADHERRLAAALDRLRATRAELHDHQARRGQLAGQLERIDRQLGDLARVRAEVAETQARRGIYEQLVTAFGRDGIPALVIDNAVPEIEAAANELLASLTDGRMALRIRLQRPLQAGGERETLEVEISDELGTRSYESYSGGEAFRVDFALRLALSRLLAHRAGARLRTLVIDEGFGTQDEQGLEQLVESIHAVRDEFDLVLVITHLATLKDRFETRIEVTKEPERGSRYRVVTADM